MAMTISESRLFYLHLALLSDDWSPGKTAGWLFSQKNPSPAWRSGRSVDAALAADQSIASVDGWLTTEWLLLFFSLLYNKYEMMRSNQKHRSTTASPLWSRVQGDLCGIVCVYRQMGESLMTSKIGRRIEGWQVLRIPAPGKKITRVKSSWNARTW